MLLSTSWLIPIIFITPLSEIPEEPHYFFHPCHFFHETERSELIVVRKTCNDFLRILMGDWFSVGKRESDRLYHGKDMTSTRRKIKTWSILNAHMHILSCHHFTVVYKTWEDSEWHKVNFYTANYSAVDGWLHIGFAIQYDSVIFLILCVCA